MDQQEREKKKCEEDCRTLKIYIMQNYLLLKTCFIQLAIINTVPITKHKFNNKF